MRGELAARVGRNVRYWRTLRGLKQTALAELVGYTAKDSGSISKLDRVQNLIDVDALTRFAQALQVEVAVLLRAVRERLLHGGPRTSAPALP